MSRTALNLACALIVIFCAGTMLHAAPTVAELEKQLADNPDSVTAMENLAEAYLVDCDLEKSLELWRRIAALRPDHVRAKFVIDRLTLQALDLQTQLSVLGSLIDSKATDGVGELLDASARRAVTDEQKARILFLRGQLALATSAPEAGPDKVGTGEGPARASAAWQTAIQVYPQSTWAGRSALALAQLERDQSHPERARRILENLTADDRVKDASIKEEARLRLLLLDDTALAAGEKIAALRDLVGRTADPAVRRLVLVELIQAIRAAEGKWVPEAVEALGARLKTSTDYEQTRQVLGELEDVAHSSRDPVTVDAALAILADYRPADAATGRRASLVHVRALLARAAMDEDAAAVRRFVVAARTILDRLEADGRLAADRKEVQDLQGETWLVEAQKLMVLTGPADSLPVLMKVKDHYLAMLARDPETALERLEKIGMLLEHVHEWETAVELYREMATKYAHTEEGRDALLKIAGLYSERLDAPMEALAVLAEYAGRYPAELPYRQRDVGARLARLGYANVLEFQKRNGLKPDGLVGPSTRARLEQLEGSFDLISLGQTPTGRDGVLQGEYVHPMMFRIAHDLEQAGNHHDAILAYRMCLNLFPTKMQADDALIAIARLLRDNLLFEEALGAYAELMEDYPKGDKTSLAYIEAAQCCENLGRWSQARDLYALYVKNFPTYDHVQLCRSRTALLAEIEQYETFIRDNPQNPKLAEAQYQIATTLYKQFENFTKSAVEFEKVAARHPKHVRAADALFTAGTAQLRAENFPEARRLFAKLAADYAESRLADDAQFWTGHTYEYSARALGKLDERRIVLVRRGLEARSRLVADLTLRRRYNPEAKPGPGMPEEVWGGDTLGVLASGSVRDRVNADLYRAVRAYREVVDKFKMGDMAGPALLRTAAIYTKYLKDPDKGIASYQELLEHYPASQEAADALIEVGAYHLEKKDYDQAIKAYQQFIYNYPKEAKVEDAMLAIVRGYIEQKDWSKALDACESYLSRFPQGRYVDFAKAQVAWIRMYHF